MAQCNCSTEWYTTYDKWTFFWELDKEGNRDTIAQLENEFATWLQSTEQSFRDQEYDNSELRPYSCQGNSPGSRECSCYFYNKLTFKNQDGELYPLDDDNLNEDPEEPPGPIELSESAPQGVQQSNSQCTCTSTSNGNVISNVPNPPVAPTITTVDRKSFPIDVTFKFKADKFIEIGCKDNKAPAHMQYNDSSTEVTSEFNFPGVAIRYLLKRQVTKWRKSYKNNHTC
jgi:hypothetical protein